MLYPFGHLVGAWLLGKGFEWFRKEKLHQNVWFFLLLGAIIPDGDFLLNWIFGVHSHRTFTHSILFAIALGVVAYLVFLNIKSRNSSQYGFALFTGVMTHLLFDLPDAYGIPLLWPFLGQISLVTLTPEVILPLFSHNLEGTRVIVKKLLVDTSLGVIWFFWLWWRGKVRF